MDLTEDEIDEFVNEIMADDIENASKLKKIVTYQLKNFNEEKIEKMLNDIDTMTHKEFFKKYCMRID
jgi:hypothetical protein